MKKGKIKISKKGCDWHNCQLNENYHFRNCLVMFNDNFYRTGNRRNTDIELFVDGNFIITVSMRYISLVKIKFEL